MRLDQLLSHLSIRSVHLPDGQRDIDFITNDSREVRPGALYIAIAGSRFDGHDFLAKVAAAGAAAAMVERIDPAVALPQYLVEDARRAWSRLSAAYHGYPTRDLFVHGITATNGKTTMAFMLDEILRAQGLNTGLIGTVKIRIGNEVTPATMTTPESFALQGYFARMRDAGVDTVTMEVSSLALAQHRCADVAFNVVSFNNFSREHIDEHGSEAAYWAAKASLITGADPATVTIINLSDPAIAGLRGHCGGQEVTYSLETGVGDLYPEDLDLSGDFPKFTLVVARDLTLHPGIPVIIPAGRIPIELGTPGRHTVANAVACAAMALCQGIPPRAIQTGLRAFRGLERRFELIFDGDFRIIDDHFANTNNIEVSLDSLASLRYKRLHLVYAIRGSRGVTVNRENVQTLARWVERLGLTEIIVTPTLGEVGPKDLVRPEETAAFVEEIANTPLKVTWRDTMDEALTCALDAAGPGDIIFLAGTQGMDKGGRKILNMLADREPGRREEILRAVADRICG